MARKRQPENKRAVITNGIVMVQQRLINDVYKRVIEQVLIQPCEINSYSTASRRRR
jgi:hypothetical protein